MPLDPSISLQGRGVDIKPLDPVSTLLQVSQIKNMQTQEQMRQLQMAQLGATMAQYRGLQAPGGPLAQLGGLSQGGPVPGMVPGNQLGQLAPGGLPSAPPTVPLQAPVPGIAPLYNQLSPATQAAYPNGPPPDAGIPPQAIAPAGIPTGSQNAPQGQPGPPNGGLEEDAGTRTERQAAIYKDMLLKYPLVAPHIVTPLIAVDQQVLAQRKGELELHTKAMEVVDQSMASVMDQPAAMQPQAYVQMRQTLLDRGVPGATKLPPQFDPQVVQTFATSARDTKTRVEQQLAGVQKQIDSYGKITERMAEERQGRAVTSQQTASGVQLQKTFPQRGETGTTPMVGPNGQPVLPPEYGRNKEVYDAQGNLYIIPENTPPGQQPMAQRPRMATPPIPGYSAHPGAATGAMPQPGQPPALMNQQAVQSNLDVGRKVQETQLNAAIPQAEAARNSLNTLSQIKQIMHQGYYDDVFAKDLASADAQKILIANGRDPQKLANTFQIQNLASQLVIDAQGGRGLRVGPTEIGKLNAASGRLDTIPPKAAAMQTVEQLRQIAIRDLEHYNTLTQSPNTPQLRPYAVPQTIPKAEFDKRYIALKALNPQLTKDELALRYERAGAHVEGAY